MALTNAERIAFAMNTADVNVYRDSTQIGASAYIKTHEDDPLKKRSLPKDWVKVHIEAKAPYLAQTDKGAYRWADLCRWAKEHKDKYGY